MRSRSVDSSRGKIIAWPRRTPACPDMLVKGDKQAGYWILLCSQISEPLLVPPCAELLPAIAKPKAIGRSALSRF